MSLKTNCVASWSFGNGSNPAFVDDSGNGHVLTAVNSPTLQTTGGKPLHYLDLVSASSQYLTTPDAADLTFWNGTNDLPFSLSCWVKMSASVEQYMIAKRDGATASNSEWALSRNSVNQISFRCTTTNNDSTRLGILATGSAINTSTWTHIVATYDGSHLNTGMKIYTNGNLINTSTSNNAGTYLGMQNSTAAVVVGANKPTASYGSFLNGSIDGVNIFNKELNYYDVLQLYSNGNGINYPFISGGMMQFFNL